MQEIKVKEIDITPDKSLMPKIGQAGYSISQAISELIDNAVDARFPDKMLTIQVTMKPDYIEIIDDGKGMNEEQASKCLKLAYSEKKNQLGEFGLGLKTAAQSLGRTFSVITTPLKDENEYIIKFDEDEWLKKGDWAKHPMKIKKSSNKEESGTTVLIQNLKIKYYANLATSIKEDLGIRFAPYIENELIRIKVNTLWCKPAPLELTSEGKEPFELTLSDGNKIRGWVGLLKRGESDYYGFNTFRHGRLISQHDKIGFNPHPEVRQIATFMKPFLAKARSYTKSKIVDKRLEEKMEVQMENIAKAIRKTQELKGYAMPNAIEEEASSEEGQTESQGEIEIEKREQAEIPIIQEYKEPETEKDRNPKKTHRKIRYVLTINGKKFKFSHDFKSLGDTNLLKDKILSEENGIEVFTNTDFPAFPSTKDPLFYATYNIAEAIAEVMVEEKNEPLGNIFRLRNLILKQTGNIMRELDEEKQLAKEVEEQEKQMQDRKRRLAELREGKEIPIVAKMN
ncbi:ATP-binding protein [Candidatus Woesearchaeota archaeon]|nr:ATP-binding protein [Candidatus Woesearchaeota archaeon]